MLSSEEGDQENLWQLPCEVGPGLIQPGGEREREREFVMVSVTAEVEEHTTIYLLL